MARERGTARREATRTIRPRGPQTHYDVYTRSDKDFEELCCALWSADGSVRDPDLYGRPRRKQFGIDVFAERAAGDGCEGISCKRYKTLQKGQIAQFANEFLDHWESHWKPRNFKRFILCVACDVSGPERRREVDAEKARFKAIGVEFVVWSARILSNRIHQNPGIADAYFEPDGTDFRAIRKLIEQKFASSAASLSVSGDARPNELLSALDSEVQRRLDELQHRLRTGDVAHVQSALMEICTSAQWPAIAPPTRARALRMRAALYIDDAPHTATALLKEADELHADTEGRTRALLAFRLEGPVRALEQLQSAKSKESALLSCALLLEAGRTDDAQALLREWAAPCKQDPEWHRLSAHLALALGHADDAVAHTSTAEQLAPDWVGVLESAGRMHFAAAMPVSRAKSLGAVPEPSDIELVGQDAESQSHLGAALDRFARVAQLTRGVSGNSRIAFWRLACLACMPSRGEQARALCAELLEDTSLCPSVVGWALQAGYPFDHLKVIRRLERRLREKVDALDAMQALVLCALSAGDFKKAAATVRRFRSRNTEAEALRIAQLWEDRVALSRGELRADAESLDFIDRLQRLAMTASGTDDWNDVQRLLDGTQGDAEALYMGCRLLASHRQWPRVVRYVDRLLDELGTAAVVRLVAHALYNTDHHARVVELLDQHARAFPGEVLPYELQRLKAHAAAGSGDLKTARVLANSLLQRSSGHVDHQFAIGIALQGGDVAGAVALLRNALNAKSLSLKQALRFLPSIATEEPAFARHLLQEAAASGVDPQASGFMTQWFYRLGLDADAHQLVSAMTAANDASSSFRAASLEEAKEFFRQRHEHTERVNDAYRRGEVPIHAVVDTLDVNLASVWERVFREGTTTLFLRSGNRARKFFTGSVPYRPVLHPDVTALLTIDHLGLWGELDRSGLAIVLPPTCLIAIHALEQTARHHQPSRIRTMREVLRACDAGTVVVQQASPSDGHGWARVVFGAEQTAATADASSTLPAVSLRALVEHLVALGKLDRSILENALKRSSFEQSVAEVDLAEVRHLLFEGNTIDQLVDVSVLDVLTRDFGVHAESGHIGQLRTEVAAAAIGDATADRLADLRSRLRQRVDDDSYRLHPAISLAKEPDEGPESPVTTVLHELLVCPRVQEGWLWIDDRTCTSFAGSNHNLIVSTFEVLDYLHDAKLINDERFYSLLRRLREAGIQMLPVGVDEVTYWLSQAPICDDALTETPALGVLRRSFNWLLAHESYLNLGWQASEGRHPEYACLLGAFQLARTCIDRAWSSSATIAEKRARSEWIWESLRVQFLERMPPNSNVAQKVRLWRMALAHLLCIGLGLPIREDGGEGRKAYFEWLQMHVLDFSERGDPAATAYISEHLAESLLSNVWRPIQENRTAKEIQLVRAIMGAYIAVLPSGIRSALQAHPGIREVIVTQVVTTVGLGGFEFPADKFWTTLAELGANEERAVVTVTGQAFMVRGQPPRFELSGPAALQIVDPEFALLSSSIESRRDLLTSLQDRITPAAVEEIATEKSPAQRMLKLRDAQDATPAGRYALLIGRLGGPQIEEEHFQPVSASAQLAYLGVRDGDCNDWEQAAAELLQRCELSEALRRFAALPIPLPTVLGDRIAALDAASAQALLSRAFDAAATPMMWLQSLRWRAGRPELLASANELAAHILERWRKHVSAFLAILQWAERTWRDCQDWRELPVAPRLACVWSHADAVLSCIMAADAADLKTARALGKLHPPGTRHVLSFDRDYEQDVSAPSRMTSPVLLLQGLGTIETNPLLPAMRDQLFEIVSKRSEGESLPSIHLYEDRRAAANALRSYLASDVHPWVQDLYDDGRLAMVSDAARDHIRSQTAQLLSGALESGMSWVQLSAIGFQWLRAQERGQIESMLPSFKFPAGSASTGDKSAILGLTVTIPFVDERVQRALFESALEWVGRLGRLHAGRVLLLDGDDASARDASIVTELMFNLTRRHGVDQANEVLRSMLREATQRWPELAGLWRPLVERLIAGGRAEEMYALWPEMVRMRVLDGSTASRMH